MKKKLWKRISLILLVILLQIGFVFSGIMPDDEPFRVEGTYQLNGSNAPVGLTLNAFVNNIIYKNYTSTGSGSYVVTVGGTSGDTVNISVCGINQASTAFIPYSSKTINVAAVLQADGVRGCTCNSICNGSYCVNPGLTTGVCSSNSYYCDNDATCEASYGETTVTCPSDCPSGGGSSSGGGGSSSNGGTGFESLSTTNTTTNLNPQLTEAIANALNIDEENITNIELVDSKGIVTSTGDGSDIANDLTGDMKQAVLDELAKGDEFEAIVTTNVKTYDVTTSGGGVKRVTLIEKIVEIKSGYDSKSTMTIVEIVPKDVASSASMISGDNLKVFAQDPVVGFVVPVSSFDNNKYTIRYYISGDVFDKVNTIKTITINNPISTQTPTVTPTTETPTTTTPTTTTPANETEPGLGGYVIANMPTIVGSILALIIIISIIIIVVVKKKEEKEIDNEEVSEEEGFVPEKSGAQKDAELDKSREEKKEESKEKDDNPQKYSKKVEEKKE